MNQTPWLLMALMRLCPMDADEAGAEALARAQGVLLEQGALKGLLGAKSPISVRCAAYSLVALLCQRCASPMACRHCCCCCPGTPQLLDTWLSSRHPACRSSMQINAVQC